jgi:ribosomal RNA methyltransferase Nop2
MLQAASSFLPVIALDPQPGEKCLDMSAAPGGKTTFMSAMMKNTGKLFANDSSKARCKSLMANVSRMGCHNVVISNHDARDFPKVMGGFNRVLLDAPCSGTGVISKDASVKNNKVRFVLPICENRVRGDTSFSLMIRYYSFQSEKDLLLLSHLQKQLILSAIDSVSPHSTNGGYLVYSTCSVTVEENESVVDYALKKRPNVKLVETGIGFGKEGFVRFRGKIFNPSLKMTRRFYPHVHNVDGFFVAKLKVNPKAKTGSSTRQDFCLISSIYSDKANVCILNIDFKAPIQEEEEDNDVVVEETVSQDDIPDKKQKALKGKDEPIAFDDSEDAEIIASAKISQLKAKGIHVTRPNPEKKRTKKHQDDQPDATEKKQAAQQQPDEPAPTEKVQSKKHQRDEQDSKEKKKKKTKVKAS